MMHRPPNSTRRRFLGLAGGAAVLGAVPVVTFRPAEATPAMLTSAIRGVTNGANVRTGKVKLDVPPLVENGNTVPVTVTVESAMTPADHVRAIHVVTEKNPQPNVMSCRLGPRAGRAMVSTRCRLSDTQTVIALAEMADGSYWSHSVSVIITLGACLEDLI
jgi:sulfur-oxidizing protein SoxY